MASNAGNTTSLRNGEGEHAPDLLGIRSFGVRFFLPLFMITLYVTVSLTIMHIRVGEAMLIFFLFGGGRRYRAILRVPKTRVD